MDTVTGTVGNDVFNAAVGTGGTFTAADVLDGAAGDDTLKVVDVASGGTDFSAALLNVSNIETLAVRGVDDLNVQAATVAFTTIKTTQSVDSTVVANAASNVEVSGATGAISVDGGKDITVTDATASKAITVGATTAVKGAVTITDTKVGNASIAVDGGTDVTINVAGVADVIDATNSTTIAATTDVISVGIGGAATDLPSGAVLINQAHTGTAGTDVTLNTVNVKGGTSVAITNTADSSKAAADTTGATLTQGAIKVTGGATTTAVTVNQVAVATENLAVTAVAAKAATTKVTFTALAANEYITLTGDTNKSITFTAAKALTALEVAAAFANLVSAATTGSAPVTNGVYTNGSSGTLAAGFTTGAVTSESATTASVTFSTVTDASAGTAGIQAQAITGTSSGSNARVTVATSVAGNVATLAETGVLGVTAGSVVVDGAITGTDVLTTVNLNAYGDSSTVASDALTTLNLSNANEDVTVTTASTGSIILNLDKVAGANAAVSLDGSSATVTGLTINATGTKSDVAVTAAAATAVTINADVNLDLTSSSFGKATKITVVGAGDVILDGDASTSVLAAVDASGATGAVNAAGVALTAAGTYTGGSGVDTFTVTASATKASTGGAGDDVITVSSFATGGSVDAGEGTDTLVMTEAAAATADANTTFSTKATNFERLTISTANTAASTLDLANLGLTTYVTTSGTGQTVFSDATAYVATDKIVLAINGTTVTTVVPTIAGTDAQDDKAVTDAINAAANTALSTSSVVYVAAALTDSDKALTVSAASGAVTVSGIGMTDTSDSSLASTVADTALVLDNLSSGSTVALTKDGTITAQVKDASTGTADVITVAMSQDGSLDAGSFTANNVETVNITADDKVVDVTGAKDEFGADIADGKDDTNSVQTLALTADKATTVNVSGSADLTLDLVSSSAVSVVNAADMTGKFTLVADGKSTGTTVTGGSGVDTLTADGSYDVLIGGAGNDILKAANLSTLTGGEGNDTFSFAAVDATLYSTITDLSAGDVIDLATGSGFTTAKVSLATSATFAQYLDAAIVAAAAGATTIGAAWFQFGGDTYIVSEAVTTSGNTYGSGDGVISITGLVDLSTALFNGTTGDLTIA